MSLRQFGFKKDDEHFLKDAFDPLTRRSLMIELLSIRKRTMIGFWFMFSLGILYGLVSMVNGKSALMGIIVVFFLSAMFLGLTLHADVKYKLVRVLARLSEGESENVN